jgi:hypothetical protein
MTRRKRLEGALAEWHPHPKSANSSLIPVVRDAPAVDEVTDRFFDSTPHGYTPEPLPAAEASDASVRRSLIHSPAARERRRYLMRYVASAVAIAGLIGAGALVRVGVTHVASAATSGGDDDVARATAVELAPQTNAGESTESMARANPTPAAMTEPPSQPVAAIAAPIDGPSAPAANAPAVDPPAPANATDGAKPAIATDGTPDPAGAALAKREAQTALERGHLKTSVEAGERSVALDPSDAEAWLILGAAYQGRGRYNDARRCFTSCTKVATRGDRGECRALLR